MSPLSALVISDETEFARTLLARWQVERTVPAITVLSSDLSSRASLSGSEIVIVGPVRSGQLASLLEALDGSAAAVLCVTSDALASASLRAAHPRLLLIPQSEGWPDALIQLAAEALRRVEAVARARQSEQAAASARRHALLGRYLLETRHTLNDALTSVLGNADLLLLDAGPLPAETREQIQAIHTMVLRLHEILQRFSSLASELQLAEKESQTETQPALSPR